MSINLITGEKTEAGTAKRKALGPTFREIGIPALAAAAMQNTKGDKAKKPAKAPRFAHETLPQK